MGLRAGLDGAENLACWSHTANSLISHSVTAVQVVAVIVRKHLRKKTVLAHRVRAHSSEDTCQVQIVHTTVPQHTIARAPPPFELDLSLWSPPLVDGVTSEKVTLFPYCSFIHYIPVHKS